MKPSWRYCGPPGRSPFALAIDWVRGGGPPAWAQLTGSRVELTWRCTTAIRRVLDSWHIGPGDEVLMPAYHCGTEVDAVMSTGASVVLYRVGLDLRIDEPDLCNRITGRTRVVYVIHYFGWPQELARLSARCRGAGIRLLEDCALALFSDCGTREAVALSDASVFSLSKTLSVTDGGAAVWRTEHETLPPLRREGSAAVTRRSLPLIRRSTLRRLSRMGLPGITRVLGRRPASQRSDEMPRSYYFTDSVRGVSMSRCARGSTRRAHRDLIGLTRRRNFLRLLDRLNRAGLTGPLKSLPEGVCPLTMPILVEDRDAAVRALSSRGIEVIPWWAGGHRSVQLQEFPEAKFLKEHVIALPVHQQLTEADIDFIAEAAEAVLGGMGREESRPILAAG
jgi:perosamine synthetase